MGQAMRVTVDAAMRARDVSRDRSEDEAPRNAAAPSQPVKPRRGEKRRLAKRRAARL
ncbi:hypothetical protein NE235_33635 [Actinoallomurus spadix]|uniref:Uncharacterized protein n=1 Tax=Actinoallomurus spadix TaxID=79912 RepID=A0ABN0XSH5_9ACTN|nr:hypothetical protein [Actinoallomurus spadix]MCO5991063.1 hypothetical protein [Actinoallomurus spadix]